MNWFPSLTTYQITSLGMMQDMSCHVQHLFYKYATNCMSCTSINPTNLSKQLELFKPTNYMQIVRLTSQCKTQNDNVIFYFYSEIFDFVCPQHTLVAAIHDDKTINGVTQVVVPTKHT